MRAMRLVRYRFSMVVCDVFGRPLASNRGGGAPAIGVASVDEADEDEEMGLERLSLDVSEVGIGGVVGGGVDAADEEEEMGERGWARDCCGIASLFDEPADFALEQV